MKTISPFGLGISLEDKLVVMCGIVKTAPKNNNLATYSLPSNLWVPSAPVLLQEETAAEKAGVIWRGAKRSEKFSPRKTQTRRLRIHEAHGLKLLLKHYKLGSLPEDAAKYKKLALRLALDHVPWAPSFMEAWWASK